MQNGYEVIESYHRTSANFLPNTISIRGAGLSMINVASEIDRFPVYELSDQGPRSTARNLVAVGTMLKLINFGLEPIAVQLQEREGTAEDRDTIREFVGGQLKVVEAIFTGKELKRPEWPIQP